MTTRATHDGNVVQYTSSGGNSAGDVVVLGAAGNVTVGVVLNDIAAGSTGSVAIAGGYTLPKVSGAVIAQGESVNLDVSAGAVDDNAATAAPGDVSDFGIALEAAGNGATSVIVLLLPGNGSIT